MNTADFEIHDLVRLLRRSDKDSDVQNAFGQALHREGHEGYSGYAGQLPNGVALGDPEGEVVRKMGQPAATGGGGMSSVLKRAIPRWLEYPIDDAYLHFQLAPDGRVEMATVYAPDIHARRR